MTSISVPLNSSSASNQSAISSESSAVAERSGSQSLIDSFGSAQTTRFESMVSGSTVSGSAVWGKTIPSTRGADGGEYLQYDRDGLTVQLGRKPGSDSITVFLKTPDGKTNTLTAPASGAGEAFELRVDGDQMVVKSQGQAVYALSYSTSTEKSAFTWNNGTIRQGPVRAYSLTGNQGVSRSDYFDSHNVIGSSAWRQTNHPGLGTGWQRKSDGAFASHGTLSVKDGTVGRMLIDMQLEEMAQKTFSPVLPMAEAIYGREFITDKKLSKSERIIMAVSGLVRAHGLLKDLKKVSGAERAAIERIATAGQRGQLGSRADMNTVRDLLSKPGPAKEIDGVLGNIRK